MKKILLILVLGVMMMGCCTTKYVPVEKVRVDTLYKSQTVWDSIYIHDSTIVERQGDTVYIRQWRDRWHDRWKTDTIYRSRTDSVPKPYPVEVKVPAELTSWQVFRIHAGEVAIVALLVALGLYFKRKF